MITNISRQLTTGALAIAGSVAAFGFAGAAQAAQLNANIGYIPMGTVSYAGSNLASATSVTFPTLNYVNTNQPLYRGLANDFYSGLLAVAIMSTVAISPLTFDFSAPDGVAGGGAFTVTFTTASGPATFTATSFTTASATPDTVDLYINGITTGTGFDPSPSSLLVNLNQVSGPGGVVNASTTFSSPPINKVPEPSAILGILAVAGIGAFARRKS
ncbi:PEP-CTERM sorting domain-containing protein [Microcystis aeruginosa]|uniref:PEP-CTERM sorting domain-containing protein n=1 Tax=Microcystis aeruginosa TaxID=1126 RepID=UPI0009341FBD|nr:PEP-CTERM sorting domain-containing protein [Microcystis aeruginosa]